MDFNKKGQEEMVGFMIIVVIVTLVILFFLVFSWQSGDSGSEDSLEASSFLQSALSYTTGCHNSIKYLTLDDLISACYKEESCDNEEYSCDVLNETLQGILDESWPVGAELRYKGYKFEAVADNSTLVAISKGNVTGSYKGTRQILPVSSASIQVTFTAYS